MPVSLISGTAPLWASPCLPLFLIFNWFLTFLPIHHGWFKNLPHINFLLSIDTSKILSFLCSPPWRSFPNVELFHWNAVYPKWSNGSSSLNQLPFLCLRATKAFRFWGQKPPFGHHLPFIRCCALTMCKIFSGEYFKVGALTQS